MIHSPVQPLALNVKDPMLADRVSVWLFPPSLCRCTFPQGSAVLPDGSSEKRWRYPESSSTGVTASVARTSVATADRPIALRTMVRPLSVDPSLDRSPTLSLILRRSATSVCHLGDSWPRKDDPNAPLRP